MVFASLFAERSFNCKNGSVNPVPKLWFIFFVFTSAQVDMLIHYYFVLFTSKKKKNLFTSYNDFGFPLQMYIFLSPHRILVRQRHSWRERPSSSLTQKCHRSISNFYIKQTGKVRRKRASAGSLRITLGSLFCTSGAIPITSELSCWWNKISSSIKNSWLKLNRGMW